MLTRNAPSIRNTRTRSAPAPRARAASASAPLAAPLPPLRALSHISGPRLRRRRAPSTLRAAAPRPPADMSFDADDDLDADLAAELSRRARGPDAWRARQRQLELAWAIRRSRGGSRAECGGCGGSGETECNFCHGTGARLGCCFLAPFAAAVGGGGGGVGAPASSVCAGICLRRTTALIQQHSPVNARTHTNNHDQAR